ncbi:MAG: LPXTG cell wall anchor domain-containing protein [Pseudomonadota bacterium]
MIETVGFRVAVLAAGLAFASIAAAQEAVGTHTVQTDSNWPWIAIAGILTLLFAVSFVSRRRIYAVVGS